jgi:hypothetical protein
MVTKKRKSETKPEPAPSRRRAVLICNGSFQYMDHRLPGVAKDAEHLTRALEEPVRAGFEVTCLLDKGLLAVRRAIGEACALAGPDDTLLIYYSGTSLLDSQGMLQLPVFDSDPSYLTATCVESEFILAQMRQSRCQRFALIIDGCHSGAFFRNNRGIPDGLVALTSCSADETSMDTPDGGAFTQSLLKALTDPTADRNNDGCITVDEAFEFIRQDLPSQGFNTHAQKWVWNQPEPIVLVKATARVFLSYSRVNAKLATALANALQRKGIVVWRDVSGIPGGAQWRDSLIDALGKSDALLLLMTPDSLDSKWVRREIEFADGKSLPIMPVVSEAVVAPDWFALQFGGVQLQKVDAVDIDRSAAELALAVRRLIATSPRPNPAARATARKGR